MRGLAAWRGAGVQYTHVVMNIQQARRILRTGILYRNPAIKKVGQFFYRHRFFQLYCIRLDQVRDAVRWAAEAGLTRKR